MSAGGLANTRTTQTPFQRSVISKSGLRDGHGAYLICVFPTANVDTTFSHPLGRNPVGYYAVRVPVGGGLVTDPSTGVTAWTRAVIVLRVTVAGTYTIYVL